jgi:DNA damage-binding protein 1
MLQKLRPRSFPTDHLFVGTDRYNYFTLSWDASNKQLKTEKSYVDLADKNGRDSQSRDRCYVDPTRQFLVLELYEGIMTVVPLFYVRKEKGEDKEELEIRELVGTPGEPIPVRIGELFVRSSAFLHPRVPPSKEDNPRLVLLYDDGHENGRVKLKIRSLAMIDSPESMGQLGSAEFEEERHLRINVDPTASHLIPVPAPVCESERSTFKT